MILAILSIVIFFYISASLLLFSSSRLCFKLLVMALLLAISQKYVFYKYLGGAFFAPVLPRALLMLMEALYGALILLFFLLLLKDGVLLILWLGRRTGALGHCPLPLTAIKATMVGVALILGFWGTWQSIRVPDIRTIELRLADLPQGLDGFSIVQLTDLHIGLLLKKDWLQQVVDKTNSLSPDLIVLTGDYIDGTPADLAEDVAPLAGLRAQYGTFGVAGNHEYYWGIAQWSSFLEELQVIMLHNEHLVLDIGEDSLVIAGMPDPVAQRFGEKGPDIHATMAQAPDVPRLLLTHRPGNAAGYSQFADVQLAGHTHGGQMLFLRPLVALFNSGFVVGHYGVNGMDLYVSAGTGLWGGFLCRVGVPSEITHLVLRAG